MATDPFREEDLRRERERAEEGKEALESVEEEVERERQRDDDDDDDDDRSGSRDRDDDDDDGPVATGPFREEDIRRERERAEEGKEALESVEEEVAQERQRDRDDGGGGGAGTGGQNGAATPSEPFDPTSPDSPSGTAVTGTEAERVASGEVDVENLEEMPALVSQLERLGFPDIRGEDIPGDLERAIERGEVTASVRGGEISVERTERGRQAQRERAAASFEEQFEEELGVGVPREQIDIRKTEEGFEGELRESFFEGLSTGERRDVAAETAPDAFRQEDILEEIERAEAGQQSVFTPNRGTGPRSRRRRRVIEEIEAEIEAGVGEQRLERLGFGDQFAAPPGTTGTTASGTQPTPEMAREFADLTLGEDFIVDIERTPEGLNVEAELTESFEEAETRRAAATAFERETSVPIDPEEDIEVEEGRPVLTEAAERRVLGDEFERDILRVPVGIETEPVPDPPGPSSGGERVTGFETRPAEDILRDIDEASQDIGEEFAEDFAFATPASPLAAGTLIGTGSAPLPGPAEEVDVDSPLQEQAESAVQGIGDILTAPVGLGLGALELAEFGAEVEERRREEGLDPALELTAEESEETARGFVEGLEEQVRSPTGRARLAGGLVASGGIFAGARAIGPRASLATRGAIQPGEEIAGIGGFAATRRVAGRGTAERFFPGKEPLIFSEEAAIRGAKRAGGRVRSELRRTNVDVGVRPGMGLGGLELEIEREDPRTITEEDIAEPFDRPRPGRVSEGAEPEPISAFERRRRRRRIEEIERPRGEVERGIERRRRARLKEAEAERGRELTRRRLESALGLEPLEMEGLGFEQRTGLGIREEFESDQRVEPGAETEFRAEQRLRQDIETRQETGLRRETEQEFEQEQEFEIDFELESEFESEVSRSRGGRRGRSSLAPLGLGFEEVQFQADIPDPGELVFGVDLDRVGETGFIGPVTGVTAAGEPFERDPRRRDEEEDPLAGLTGDIL